MVKESINNNLIYQKIVFFLGNDIHIFRSLKEISLNTGSFIIQKTSLLIKTLINNNNIIAGTNDSLGYGLSPSNKTITDAINNIKDMVDTAISKGIKKEDISTLHAKTVTLS